MMLQSMMLNTRPVFATIGPLLYKKSLGCKSAAGIFRRYMNYYFIYIFKSSISIDPATVL